MRKFWLKSKTILINGLLTLPPILLLILDELQAIDMSMFLSPQGVVAYTIAIKVGNIVLRTLTTRGLTAKVNP
jgi:hypothetical protein